MSCNVGGISLPQVMYMEALFDWTELFILFHVVLDHQGAVIFHDVFDNGRLGAAQMRVEGVYIWPFKQLRLVVSRYILL